MFTIIVLLLVGLLAIVIAIIATRPATFRVSRSATMAAPAEVTFAQINDLRLFQAWNPFGDADPNHTKTFEGPPQGVGSIFRWSGNNKVGQGSMTIVHIEPQRRVRIQLDFIKPFRATHQAEFTFEQSASTTTVTWIMTGDNNFISKAFQMFCSMDTMVGSEFNRGLAKLKTIVEAPAA